MKRIYVNTSFQLVNYLWGVLLQNSYWKLSRFFNRRKSFKKRRATRTSVNISQSRMLWLSLFWILEYCLISFCRNHMKRPQPVANMWCEDLVLLRSHQDLANVTHHLVAGRLSLRSVLYEKWKVTVLLSKRFQRLTSSCFLLCRWCRGLFFSTSSPWITSFSNLVNLVLNIKLESVFGHSGACQPPLLLLRPQHPSQCSAEAFPPAHRDRWVGWQRRRTSRGPKASSLSGACRTSRWSVCCFPGVAWRRRKNDRWFHYLRCCNIHLKRTKSESFLQMIFSLTELLTFGMTSNPWDIVSY